MGDKGRTTEGGRHLTENEAAILESLLRAAVRLSNRCHEIASAIRTIDAEGRQSCSRCDEVRRAWENIQPDWEALKSAFRGVTENATQFYLSTRLLELLDEGDIE